MKKSTIAGLASTGAAAVILFPASAGADICTTECGGGVPGEAGLTTAVTAVQPIESAQVAESIILDRLAGNHNETVLTLD
jgi:predicted transcriptional regulator